MQVETVAVAVPAGLTERLCRENRELAHCHTFPHDAWNILAFYGLAFYGANWEGSKGQYHRFKYGFGANETV